MESLRPMRGALVTMSKKFVQWPKESSMSEVVNPKSGFSRPEVLTIQFLKLINCLKLDTASEWGGRAGQNERFEEGSNDQRQHAELGFQRFSADTERHQPFGQLWLRKKFESLPWGPDNYSLRSRPSPELGKPFEPYLACGGALLTLRQASSALCVPESRLIELKFALLLDSLVIAEAARGMTSDRKGWFKSYEVPEKARRAFQWKF